MKDLYKKACESSEYIAGKINCKPEIGLVLGSGLNPLAQAIENQHEIDYKDIPNFPQTTIVGHDGKLICGEISGKSILAMKGRFHHYEGFDTDTITFYVRVFKLLGIKTLILTNAAGGINTSFNTGDLMVIKDHISLFAPSPLIGENIAEFGPRFFDMTHTYDENLIEIAKKSAISLNIDIKFGVYAFAQGPMFETPAEIKAFRNLGADAVGMSTIPEVIVARHCDIRVMGISCITNMAAGILNQKLSHAEVLENAKKIEEKFSKLIKSIIGEI